MSNKEKILQLIDSIPDHKLIFVIHMLESLKGYAETIEEIEPDEWDLEMIARAEKENDGETAAIEELAAELDIAL